MVRTRHPVPPVLLLGVGLVTFGVLLFEVLLTRIFAVTLWYYFASFAISLALLGTAAAAMLCYLNPDRWAGPQSDGNLCRFALLFALAAPTSIYVHTHLSLPVRISSPIFYAAMAGQALLLLSTFFCAGICLSIALVRYGQHVGTVYCCDLAGASLASAAAVPLLYQFSAPALVFLVSAAGCLAALSFAGLSSSRRFAWMSALLALGSLALVGLNDPCGVLTIRSVKGYGRSVQEYEFDKVFEQWSPVSRVTVFAADNGDGSQAEQMEVRNDAGAPTNLWRFDGDFSQLGWLMRDPLQIVHHLKSHGRTLVIGSAGGRDVLAALALGQSQIDAVEINPVIAYLVKHRYADYIGRIFDDPRVKLHVQDGRSFVAGSTDAYDVVQISMIDSWSGAAAGAYLFNENSLYTTQALDDYLSHLKPGGILSITRYYDWNEALRLTNLVLESLVERGAHDIPGHLLILLEPAKGSRRATVLVKDDLFSRHDVDQVLRFARQNGCELLYAPHLAENQMEPSQQAQLFRRLIAAAPRGRSRQEIVRNFPADISPPTDDRPFFFYTTRPTDFLHFDPSLHASRRMALPMLYGTLAACGLAALLVLVWPRVWTAVAADNPTLAGHGPGGTPSLAYFAALGMGFMLIEMPWIQRLTVFLGHPTWSFVVVLSTLLCAGGVGSLVSSRWSRSDPGAVLVGLLSILIAVLLVYVLVVYDLFLGLMWLGKAARIGLAMLTIAPAGFLMGMCFPLGIQMVRRVHAPLVPWAWGVNGAFSVFGAVLALVLALNFGFKATLLAGTGSYALALAVAIRFMRLRPASHGDGAAERRGELVGMVLPRPRPHRRRRRVALTAAGTCILGLICLGLYERARHRRHEALHEILEVGGKLHWSGRNIHGVDLSHSQLGDEELRRLAPHLAYFAADLESLNVSDTRITEAALGPLRLALPGCKIRR